MKNSVIIPVYNTEKYLEQCVLSVLNQPRAEDLEIVLIDDGSTDHSAEICDDIAKKDERIVVKHQKNQGLAAARNQGLEIATGQYVFFLDSDDFWSEGVYASILQKLEECAPDMMVFSMKSYYESGTADDFFDCQNGISHTTMESPQSLLKKYLIRDYSFGWCSVWYAINNRILQLYKIRYPEGLLCEDIPFSFALWCHAKSIEILPIYVYNYRRDNNQSITHQATFKFSNDLLQMVKYNLSTATEQITDSELISFIKLNLQTLVEVVLFWFTSYSKNEQKELVAGMLKLKDIYEIEPQAKKYMRKKEKIVNAAISLIGVENVAKIWGIKRMIKSK